MASGGASVGRALLPGPALRSGVAPTTRVLTTLHLHGTQAAASLRDRDSEVDRLRASAAAAATAAASSSAHALGPLDTTLRLKWLKSAHPSLTTPSALSTFLAVLLAPSPPDIDSVVVTQPKEGRKAKAKAKDKGSAVVAFKTLSAAVRVVDRAAEAGRAGDRMWEGVEVGWVGGRPEVLGPEPEEVVRESTAGAGAPSPRPPPTKAPSFGSSFPTAVSDRGSPFRRRWTLC